jgi:hypothetical protein
MSNIPDKCPKCGSEAIPSGPFHYPSLGFSRIHFLCDSYGYNEEPFRLARRSDFCCEREERNLLERERNEALAEAAKWERLHDEDTDHLSFLQARDSMGPTETLNETAQRLQRERDEALEKLNSHAPDGHNASNWQFFKVREERDQWRECAEHLAQALRVFVDRRTWRDEALAKFDRLREEANA